MNRRAFLQAASAGAAAAAAGPLAVASHSPGGPTAPAPTHSHPSGLSLVEYHHEVVEGAAYDLGKAQAESLRQAGWHLFSYDHPDGAEGAREDARLIERRCPAVFEEMRGVADGFGVPFGQVLCCGAVLPAEQRCAHFAVLGAFTRDHRPRVARSYEIPIGQADLRLVTARPKGALAHIGFSEMIVGRNDGMNSDGLWMSMSASRREEAGPADEPHGLPYSLAIRSTLDTCRDVDSALAHLERLPIAANMNFFLADRSGKAALLEVAGPTRAVKRIDRRSSEPCVLSINHYQLLKPAPAEDNSTTRERVARAWIGENRGKVDTPSLRGFLDRVYPDGFCGFSPEARLGTLWSVVCEPTEPALEIRFGPPPHNGWRRFTLDGKPGRTRYWALVPSAPAP